MNEDVLQMRRNHEITYQEIDNAIHNLCNNPDNKVEYIDYDKVWLSSETISKLEENGRVVDHFITPEILWNYRVYFAKFW